MATLDVKPLEDTGLTTRALHQLGPAMTQAIHKLTDIQHHLMGDPSIPRDLLEERTTMHSNLLQLLRQAALAIQNCLEEMRKGSEVPIPPLVILHPERQASHQAQGLAAFVEQCAKLVAAINSYADTHTGT